MMFRLKGKSEQRQKLIVLPRGLPFEEMREAVLQQSQGRGHGGPQDVLCVTPRNLHFVGKAPDCELRPGSQPRVCSD